MLKHKHKFQFGCHYKIVPRIKNKTFELFLNKKQHYFVLVSHIKSQWNAWKTVKRFKIYQDFVQILHFQQTTKSIKTTTDFIFLILTERNRCVTVTVITYHKCGSVRDSGYSWQMICSCPLQPPVEWQTVGSPVAVRSPPQELRDHIPPKTADRKANRKLGQANMSQGRNLGGRFNFTGLFHAWLEG